MRILKSFWPKQEENNLEPWNINAILYFQHTVLYTWHNLSQVSLIFQKELDNTIKKKIILFLGGWRNFLYSSYINLH